MRDNTITSEDHLLRSSEVPRLTKYVCILVVVWTAIVAASLTWELHEVKNRILEDARIQARTVYEKDVLARRWNSGIGGVYVPVSDKMRPNPYLRVPRRDITTRAGEELTLVNPAYMTRMIHEIQQRDSGIRGHITSLNVIRPQNKPDSWETEALKQFEKGQMEVSSVETLENGRFMRLMRPLITEKSCLKCHAEQGYKVGDIRGGISVGVPMEPFNQASRTEILTLWFSHASLWVLGLLGLFIGARSLRKRIYARENAEQQLVQAHEELKLEAQQCKLAEQAKGKLVTELQEALAQVKLLSGLLPMCSSCKKIRDDQGYWRQLEAYIHDHSEAQVSHGICPECAKKLYPQLYDDDKE
jgi:hypothetical protein